ncbi:MAG: hypothetical protein IPJ13_13030 [Saprospiraceae bacterium]|nr:hypothetical protein [Saprospiraceae bacterium]
MDHPFLKNQRDVTWFLNLNNIEKSKQISVFCSSKIISEDHLLRLKFVKKVKDYFGDAIDWYGNGINPLAQKWEGIAPYKCHIVLENQSGHNIITEKLTDSFLGLSYPIYWGAPNVNDYFPRNSFKSIEILDWKNAINIIERVLQEDPWSDLLPNLIESKNIVLTKLNPFVRIKEIIDLHGSLSYKKQPMILRSSEQFKNTNGFISHKIKKKAGSLLIKIANKIKE